jgi:hypothetical protein
LGQDSMVTELFKYPTIASLANYLKSDKTAAPADYSQIQDRVSRQRTAARLQAMRRKAHVEREARR